MADNITFDTTDIKDELPKKKKSMFDILQEYDALMEDISNADGEITDEQVSDLLINEEDLEQKLYSYREFLRTLKTKIVFNKEDRKKSTARDNAIKNRVSHLNEYIVEAVNRFGGKSKTGTSNYKGSNFSVYIKKSKAIGIPLNSAIANKYASKIITLTVPKTHLHYAEIIDSINDFNVDLSFDISIDKKKLGDDLKANIYVCDNINCKAHNTHLLKDCTCDNIPYLINSETPVFK